MSQILYTAYIHTLLTYLGIKIQKHSSFIICSLLYSSKRFDFPSSSKYIMTDSPSTAKYSPGYIFHKTVFHWAMSLPRNEH